MDCCLQVVPELGLQIVPLLFVSVPPSLTLLGRFIQGNEDDCLHFVVSCSYG